MVSVPAVTPMSAVPRATAVCSVVLVPAMASGLCVFGSMTFVDGSVAGLGRAGLGSNVVAPAVAVGMGRWGAAVGRARRWVCRMASGVVHRVTSRKNGRWGGGV